MTTLLPWPQACLGESPRGQLRDVGGLHPAARSQTRPSVQEDHHPRPGPRLHGVRVISGPGDTGQAGGEGPRPEMHTPGRPSCGPADGEARATPAPMSALTCCLLVGLVLWASPPRGPGLWACCPPFRSSGWGQGSAPSSPMHGVSVRLSPVGVFCPYLVEALQKQDGVVPWWWGPKADIGELDAALLCLPTVPGTAGLVPPS